MNKPWRCQQSMVSDTRGVSRTKILERLTSTSGLINKTRINPHFVFTSRGTTLNLLPFAVSLDRGSNQTRYSKMVKKQVFMENLKMKRKKNKRIWPSGAEIFSNFPAHNLNFHGKWWAQDKIKTSFKRNRTLCYYGVQNVNNGGLVLGLDFCINLTSTTYIIKNCREHKICQTLTWKVVVWKRQGIVWHHNKE